MSEQISPPEIDFSKIFKTAVRTAQPLKISESGPTGSGKSYSALLTAKGIAGGDMSKVFVLDTEKSANTYAGLGEYRVAELNAPFEPERLIKAIKLAEQAGAKVIIIDSLTHFWSGPGGILDINNAYGGRFQDWAKTTPRHNAMVEAIKSSPCHIICTMRKKMEYLVNAEGGKNKVQKVGLANEQKDNFEYEFTIAFDINMDHLASTSKDRTGVFMDRTPFKITEQTGLELLNWSLGSQLKTNVQGEI